MHRTRANGTRRSASTRLQPRRVLPSARLCATNSHAGNKWSGSQASSSRNDFAHENARVKFDAASTRARLVVGGNTYSYYSLASIQRITTYAVWQLPYCLKVLLENVVRHHAT